MNTYRAGVIGLGQVGMLYELDGRIGTRYRTPSHTSAYAAHPRTTLLAGCDVSADRVDIFRSQYGEAATFTDYLRMLREVPLDIVSVSVRAETQPEIVKAAANAGVRMIFCEKPLATSADAAADVAQYCRAKGVSLVVNYWRRFDESHQRVRDLLTGGSCGSVQRFHCFYGNGLLTNGSHVVNLCLWYGGEVQRVTASFDRNDPECGDAVLEFESGARGTLSSVSYDAYRLLEVDVLGTTGRVALKNEGLDIELFGVEPNRDVHGAKQLAAEPSRIPSTVTEAFPRAITTMVSWLDADEHRAADDAVATLRVLDAIRSSARQDGRTVTLDAGTTYAQGAIR